MNDSASDSNGDDSQSRNIASMVNDPASDSNGDDSQSTDIAYMDPNLYKAAYEGNIKPFMGIAKSLNSIVTPNKNTVLHVWITSQNRTKKTCSFLEQMLDICPSLLLQVNAKGETPLHVAAKFGHSAIVRVLIERAKAPPEELESGVGAEAAKQMLRKTNNEGNTALHLVVQHCCCEVVEILTKEDPDFSYSVNKIGETPLYIAAVKKSLPIVDILLKNCKSAAHQGPKGKTALHAAAMCNDPGITKKIVGKKKSLTREKDQYGWTPLHYAAHSGCSSTAEELLKFDVSAAYIADKQRKMTALHLAVSQGHVETMRKIIYHCPDCSELVDKRGWNVLHFAMIRLRVQTLKNFVQKNSLLIKLLDENDVNGNTPLHVLAAYRRGSLLDLIEVESRLDNYMSIVNKDNVSVRSALDYGFPKLQKEIRELMKRVNCEPYGKSVISFPELLDEKFFTEFEQAKNSHLVVNALIATVTFAAAFTLPGGYQSEKGSDQGTAVLIKNTAFQAFVISDATSMILSLCAVFVYFIMSVKKYRRYLFLFHYGFWFTMLAMVAMVIAFVTGTYAVLADSLSLSIVTCFIGLSFFILVFCMVIKIGSVKAADKENKRSDMRILDKYYGKFI